MHVQARVCVHSNKHKLQMINLPSTSPERSSNKSGGRARISIITTTSHRIQIKNYHYYAEVAHCSRTPNTPAIREKVTVILAVLNKQHSNI